jgi:MFS family permease
MSDLPPLHHRFRPGTVQAALSYRDFRLVWIGAFASNIGTWMQNVALPAYIDARTSSGAAVGLLVFAQLGPLLLLSIPGGVIADKVPRRPWLVSMQVWQIVFSIILAALVARDASIAALFLANLGVGVGNALQAPAYQASIPMLVDRRDLPGAVSLNSTMINGSRVIGPSIAAMLAAWGVTTPQLFLVNAGTYLFVIAALLAVHLPRLTRRPGEQGWRQLLIGINIVRQRPVLGRLLATMAMFSFVCLPYVGLFPTVARLNLGLDPTGSTFKWLYATWGLGAMCGALAIGTVLARLPKRRLIPFGFLGFSIALGTFALLTRPALAFPVGAILGFFYFGTATSMLTVLQANTFDHERARVMSLWFMAFGGTVPLGNIVFGPVIDLVGARPVLLGGAVFALFLVWWCDLTRLERLDPRYASISQQAMHQSLESSHAASLDENGISAGE